MWWLVGGLIVLAGIEALHDARKFRIGCYLVAALSFSAVALAFTSLAWVGAYDENLAPLALLALLGLVLVIALVLGVVLMLNGLTMARRERRSLANLLSLLLGAAIFGYVTLGIISVMSGLVGLFLLLAFLGLPVGYLGFGLVAHLFYSAVYQFCTSRFGRPVAGVVVLGAGLIRGRVPPLLRSRLERGLAVYRNSASAELEPVVVPSGGQGEDEPRSEGSAMAEYLIGRGVSPSQVLVEDESRNTEENLVNSARLLVARGVEGDIAVATNGFHLLRTALIMRRLRIPGYVVGAQTAGYYWPSAIIREYVAILLTHRWFNAVALGLACLPLFLYATAGIVGLLGG